MTDPQLQTAERAARLLAHGCPVYAPGVVEPDSRYKATISGQRAAACGDKWMTLRRRLKDRGLEPLPLEQTT